MLPARCGPAPSVGPTCPEGKFPASTGLPLGTAYLYVDPDAAVGGDGSEPQPVRTLAEAVSVAPEGAVIVLARGRHEGGLSVTSSITLAGACASGDGASVLVGPVRWSGSAGALLALRVEAAGPSLEPALEVVAGTVRVDSVEFAAVAGAAISVGPAAQATITAGLFSGTGHAIEAHGEGAGVVLRAVSISGTSTTAIRAWDRARVRAEALTIDSAAGHGVAVAGGAAVELARSTITRSGGAGVHTVGAYASLVDLAVDGPGPPGAISSAAGSAVVIERLAVDGARGRAITIRRGSATVLDTFVAATRASDGVGGEGVWVDGGELVATRLRVAGSRGAAIVVDGTAAPAVAALTDVEAYSTRPLTDAAEVAFGLWVRGDVELGVVRARLEDNTGPMILLSQGPSSPRRALLSDVWIARGEEVGLELRGPADVSVERLVVEDQAKDGVAIFDATVRLADLVVRGSGASGLRIEGPRRVELERALLEDNAGMGLYASTVPRAPMLVDGRDVSVRRSGSYGAFLDDVSGTFERVRFLESTTICACLYATANLALVDLECRDTRPSPEVAFGCNRAIAPGRFASGLGVLGLASGPEVLEANLTLNRFVLAGIPDVAIDVRPFTTLHLRDGAVTEAGTGIRIPSTWSEALDNDDGVVFRSTGEVIQVE